MGLCIVLLGGPGAGKGTQARMIAQSHDLPHISTGDLFRAEVRERTEVGNQVIHYLEEGLLVPDELTCAIVANQLAKPAYADGFVLDGFPRSLKQAETLEEILDTQDRHLDVAIDLQVSDEEIVARLSARRFCPVCGEIYNLKFNPPRDGKTCNQPGCDGILIRREDDNEDTIRERLRIYHETTGPVLQYYRERGLLQSIDADVLSPEELHQQIEEVLAGVQAGPAA